MINNTAAGLKTIHTLIIQARAKAYENKNQKLADDLDTAEYLLALIMQESNTTEWFEEFLENKPAGQNYRLFCEEFTKNRKKDT